MKPLKFIIAPDSFKESLDAFDAAAAIRDGLKRVFPDGEFVSIPLADGGEGTCKVLVGALGGTFREVRVTGPLGDPVTAQYGLVKSRGLGVLEIASACGLSLVPPESRNPLETTTYGVGELIRGALDEGVREFIVGLGGSSTNDGGFGMLQALGARGLDREGNPVGTGGKELSRLSRIDLSGLDPRLGDCRFQAACDVENPLTGANGATYTFGSQKGGELAQLLELEQGMGVYARCLEEALGRSVSSVPGSGAAGGLGAAFLSLGGSLQPGAGIVLEHTDFRERLEGADYLFCGEGSVDAQTVMGKTIAGVAPLAQEAGVPLIVLAGKVGEGLAPLYDLGVSAVFGISSAPSSLREALKRTGEDLARTAENVGRLIRSGLAEE